jgi:anti-sigma28 factor (negative regulator of flagellin synthesis)
MEHKTLEQANNSEISGSSAEYNLVDFYLQPEFIKMISQQLANGSEVDFKKVMQLKQAIKDKSLVIDNLALAEKIMSFEAELFNK